MTQSNMAGDAPLVNGSELGVGEMLPTGTVTLLLADVEGSTRLWENQSDEMTAAVARLDEAVSQIVIGEQKGHNPRRRAPRGHPHRMSHQAHYHPANRD